MSLRWVAMWLRYDARVYSGLQGGCNVIMMGSRCFCYVIVTWWLLGCDKFDEVIMSYYVVTLGCYCFYFDRYFGVMWLQRGYYVLVTGCDDYDDILMSCDVVTMGCGAVKSWL